MISLKIKVYTPQFNSWNKSIDYFYLYKSIESDSQRIEELLLEDQNTLKKDRELSVSDILRISPNVSRRKRKKGHFEDEDYLDDSPWPLPVLDGCPKVCYQ